MSGWWIWCHFHIQILNIITCMKWCRQWNKWNNAPLKCKNRITWIDGISRHFGHIFSSSRKKKKKNRHIHFFWTIFASQDIMGHHDDDGAVTFTFIFLNQFQRTNWWVWVSWLIVLLFFFFFGFFDEHIHPFMSA